MSAPSIPNAPVFRRNEADFMVAAETINYNGHKSLGLPHVLMQSEAPDLDAYLLSYGLSVVAQLNTYLEIGKINSDGMMNIQAFVAGSLMTFKMIDSVYRNTAAELPALTELDEGPDKIAAGFAYEGSTPLIEVYFRGAEFRDRLPHVYHPALWLAEEMLEEPAEKIHDDLARPIGEHDDILLALRQLHFIGGAAEVALTIEDAAPDAEQDF